MPQLTVDVQAIAQLDLAIHLIQQSEQVAQYEVDSTPDDFGELYRVWGGSKGINLLGTFYQAIDGAWVSQPCATAERLRWETDAEAIAAILA